MTLADTFWQELANELASSPNAAAVPEVRKDYDGETYLSIPTGHREALEVCLEPRDGWLLFAARSWDITGGMGPERELAMCPMALDIAVEIGRATLAFIESCHPQEPQD